MGIAQKRIAKWLEVGDVTIPLDLSNLNLRSLPDIPSTVQILWCDFNQLTSLPSLDKCINLQIISCVRNQLTSLPSLDHCVALELLWCNYNQLTSLPSLDKCVALRELNCGNNQLRSLHLDNNTTLEVLWGDNNPLQYPLFDYEFTRPQRYIQRIKAEEANSRERTVARAKAIYQELVSIVWKPSQVEKWIALYELDFEEFV